MSKFSKKERLIASALSATPVLKSIIKKVFIYSSYVIYRKKYKSLRINVRKDIELFEPIDKGSETFFGYYDKSPENNNGDVLYNETKVSSSKKPNPDYEILIYTTNLKGKTPKPISKTYSYNWQQGCRAQWVCEDRIIYNFFDIDSHSYKSALYSLKTQQIIQFFDFPVQDSYQDKYFLSVNYNRIMKLRPDYGYRNLPLPDDKKMRNLIDDGIWKVDFSTGKVSLIVSLQDVVSTQPTSNFNQYLHKLNHVMISPNGEMFIFIHRWYQQGRRFDRLILFHNGRIEVLSNDQMVSHMCWVDNETLFGYLRHQGVDGFYFIDLNTGDIKPCKALNSLNNGDGHPSCFNDWIVIDTYPDKSRMQHLTMYNIKTKEVIPLIEVLHPLKYMNESRCDLHPRFSPNGERIYFDTVFTGKRRLAFIDVSEITK